ADARQVGAGALRAPLERVVPDRVGELRALAVTLRLEEERPDHLRVAEVAALAEVDVAPLELERLVRPRRGDALLGMVHDQRRDDLGGAADEDREDRQHDEEERPTLEDAVPGRLVLGLGELDPDAATDSEGEA